MPSPAHLTLGRHLAAEARRNPVLTPDLVALLGQVAWAAKVLAAALRTSGLVELIGETGEINVQGESQKKLDLLGNETFIAAFRGADLVRTMVSEELESPLALAPASGRAPYDLYVDPLDGSSNLDVNGAVGSIFSLHRAAPQGAGDEALLRQGSEQVAAGYVMYGPGTILVYTAGAGTHGFTLDPSVGEFVLSHERMQIPPRGSTYSINEGLARTWHPAIRRFIESLRDHPAGGRPYSLRYVGALVADLHRTLCDGGVYLYPASGSTDPMRRTGKLRLMYEAAPLALVTEQAGGSASTGTERILDVKPTSIHQRVPLIIGSPHEVSQAEAFMAAGGEPQQ